MFAWFSSRSALPAAQPIEQPFNCDQDAREAIQRCESWLYRLRFVCHEAPYVTHLPACRFVDGFEFVPLLTVQEVCRESEAMGNCLDTYGDRLGSGSTQVWSMRRAGRSVACVEVRLMSASSGFPQLEQVAGWRNQDVASDVLHALYRWLLAWPQGGADFAAALRSYEPRQATYQKLMKPYWLAKGLSVRLPLTAEHDFHGLFSDLSHLRGALVRYRRRMRLVARQRQGAERRR